MPTFIPTLSDPSTTRGVAVDGYVFATGTAIDPQSGRLAGDIATVAAEVARCFAAIDEALAAGGLSREHLVKTTCWISDESHRGEFIEAYRRELPPGVLPARVTMVAGLPGGSRVAIEAVAARS